MVTQIHNLLEKSEPTLSKTTSLALTISAIVIVILALVVYFGIWFWARKTRRKFENEAVREAKIKIESLRTDTGILPQNLKKYYGSKENDYDVEGTINTVYQNDYQDVLVLSSNDLYPFACVSIKTKNPIYYDVKEFDYPKFSQSQIDNPNDFHLPIKGYDNQSLDFIAIFSTKQNLNDIFDGLYSKLNPKGMIAIKMNNFPKKELNLLITHLKYSKIKFDASYFGTKFLFIVKE
ncbi:BC85_0335 family putative methyltransferase [Mycoplasma hafezii]|uniref:BC85_0335 family putative methyltransferase n=1 Tax=Mycoplasma hafezii TaxID=525886 RepID=UPI003CF9273C